MATKDPESMPLRPFPTGLVRMIVLSVSQCFIAISRNPFNSLNYVEGPRNLPAEGWRSLSGIPDDLFDETTLDGAVQVRTY
jgi:hypothetical protein